MSAFDKLKQARNVNELAQEIEPLAQALATITDESRAAITEQLATQQTQAEHWSAQQTKAAESWETTCQQAQATLQALEQQTTHTLQALTQQATQMSTSSRQSLLRQIGVSAASGVLAATVTIGLWFWLAPWNATEKRQQMVGEQIEARWQTLTAQERTQMNQLMGWH